MLNVVLYQPEIPHNTGAVGRLCLATGARLHLIKPLGFTIDDRQLKRAGLDYWKQVDVRVWDSWEALCEHAGKARFFFLSTKAKASHWDAAFCDDTFLVFGPETRGLPETMLNEHAQSSFRIPMKEEARSLNLATAVGIVLYEALRQIQHGS